MSTSIKIKNNKTKESRSRKIEKTETTGIIETITKRRGVTFTTKDPIQQTINILEDLYDNTLDLPSIIKIALIDLKQKKIRELESVSDNLRIRQATKEEQKTIKEGINSGILTTEETKKELKKLGLIV